MSDLIKNQDYRHWIVSIKDRIGLACPAGHHDGTSG